MNLTPEHLTALRTYLKEFTAAPLKEEDQSKAEAVNALIPAMIDAISDEELTDMTNRMWEFVMNSMMTSKPAEKETQTEQLNTTSVQSHNKESE